MKYVCTESGEYKMLNYNHVKVTAPNGLSASPTFQRYTPALVGLAKGECYEIEKKEPPLVVDLGESEWPYVLTVKPKGEWADEKKFYMTEGTFKHYFRPFVPRHLCMHLCSDITDLNAFLRDHNPDDIKEVKDLGTSWGVLVMEKGDEK